MPARLVFLDFFTVPDVRISSPGTKKQNIRFRPLLISQMPSVPWSFLNLVLFLMIP